MLEFENKGKEVCSNMALEKYQNISTIYFPVDELDKNDEIISNFNFSRKK